MKQPKCVRKKLQVQIFMYMLDSTKTKQVFTDHRNQRFNNTTEASIIIPCGAISYGYQKYVHNSGK
ncbi:hypothetical protein DPMN_152592 [Dreissena polymorpha]|uniref:Uncharacterized protein n=1 Tax=Dreissena polymorpha TaxID=45954 RepID=A0A9D4FKN8_DREPO|nr:hypothetical protein DPMN_152592 [Dreissena polymorpha]